MTDAYIYDAVRTPRGKGRAPKGERPGGALCGVAPQTLVAGLVDALEERLGADAIAQTQRLLLGCVGQVADQGGHIALVSKLASKIPNHASAKTLNNYCVSGLSAINESALWASTDGLTLAGGVEMLSRVPFLADQATYYTGALAADLKWLLPIMGAELMANVEGYAKADLDALSLRSHERASAAWREGRYTSGVIPVRDEGGKVVLAEDEWIRPGLTLADLEEREPAFEAMADERQLAILKQRAPGFDFRHSIANVPGLSDGAALTVTGSRAAGATAGLMPKARIVAFAECGGDEVLQFGAGFEAMERALKKAGITLQDLDLIEFMEAFAAPPLHFERRYDVDMDKVNVNGGHIAMGHPMGATGAILMTTLLHEMERRDVRLGLVVALAAGGIGSATVIERVMS